QSLCPATIIDQFGRRRIAQLVSDLALFEIGFQRNMNCAPASFLSSYSFMLVDEKSTDGRQQQRAKAALSRIGRVQVVLLQKPSKELLGQVLCVVWCVPSAPNERVDRWPITVAQLFHRFASMVRAGRQHDAPMGRRKPLGRSGRDWLFSTARHESADR